LLWGRGGPNWEFEERKYYLEQDAEWTHVQRSKNKVIGKLSVFERLSFPPKMEPVISPSNSSISDNSKNLLALIVIMLAMSAKVTLKWSMETIELLIESFAN
jgi:hypothetical protein